MSRPSSLRPALSAAAAAALVAALGTSLVGQAGPALAAPAGEPDPLLVDITRLTPAVVPTGDATLRIVGTVSNQSTEEWTDVNLHAVTSDAPMTDADTLAEAAATDAATYIGDRITEAGTFDTVASLLPGETQRFVVEVPRTQLDIPSTPGVYWLGVHALGASSLPRDDFADGRARTFLPQVPADAGRPGRGPAGKAPDQVGTAVVVPLRAPIHYTPRGRVGHPAGWTRTLSDGGRLHDLLDLAEGTAGVPLTWLVDPAVPAAVAHLAAGNPERSLAPPSDGDPDGEPTESPTEAPTEDEPDATSSEGDADEGAPEEVDEAEQAVAAAAQEWLHRFRELMGEREVLALPYGDLDVDAAAEHDPDTIGTAVRRSREVLAGLGVDSAPAITSPDGSLSRQAIGLAPSDAVVILEDSAFETPPTTPGSLVRIAGHRVLVASSGASAGGPAPSRPDAPLALRQRLLSEAALALLAGDPAPVVAVLPDDWHPEDTAGMFATGALPWLDSVQVEELTDARAPRADTPLLRTQDQVDAALDLPAFVAASAMQGPAGVLDGILTNGSDVQTRVTDEALTTLSQANRTHPERSLARARAARAALEEQLRSITLEAPESVTMSSATGSFAATVANGLDQPVTVRVAAISDHDLQMAEEEVVELAPLARTRLILDVTTTRTGMHDVRLVVTDEEGRPLGAEAVLPIRAARVSRVIWAIMAGGAALLFGAIAVRLVGRLRGRGKATA